MRTRVDILRTHAKAGMALRVCRSSTGKWKQVDPSQSSQNGQSRFSEVSKNEEGIKGNKQLYSSDLCKSTHGGTHSCVHACVCPPPHLMFGKELHESPTSNTRKLIFSFLVSIYRPSVKRPPPYYLVPELTSRVIDRS